MKLSNSTCLKANGQQVFRSIYRLLTQAEYDNPIIQQEMKEYDEAIANKLGQVDFEFDIIPNAHTPTFDPYSDDNNKTDIVPDRDESQEFDAFIGAEVLMPHKDNQIMGIVRERKREHDGSLKRGQAIPTPCSTPEPMSLNSLMELKQNTLLIQLLKTCMRSVIKMEINSYYLKASQITKQMVML